MVLITAFEGKRRFAVCDAACYDNDKPHCRCICNGRNHGVGLHHAMGFTANHPRAIAREIKRRFPKVTHVAFNHQILQTRFPFTAELTD